MADVSVLRSGTTKTAALLDWLKRWAVKGKFVFTSEHAGILVKELSLPRPESSWHMLSALENKGLIKRKKKKGVRGIIITLVKRKKAQTLKKVKSSEKATRMTKAGHPAKKRGRPKKSARRAKKSSPLTVAELIDTLKSDINALIHKISSIDNEINHKRQLVARLHDEARRVHHELD